MNLKERLQKEITSLDLDQQLLTSLKIAKDALKKTSSKNILNDSVETVSKRIDETKEIIDIIVGLLEDSRNNTNTFWRLQKEDIETTLEGMDAEVSNVDDLMNWLKTHFNIEDWQDYLKIHIENYIMINKTNSILEHNIEIKGDE